MQFKLQPVTASDLECKPQTPDSGPSPRQEAWGQAISRSASQSVRLSLRQSVGLERARDALLPSAFYSVSSPVLVLPYRNPTIIPWEGFLANYTDVCGLAEVD